MKRMTTGATLLFLAATVVVILSALVIRTSRGPTFRASDYADMDDCVANIPSEWRPGSLEHGAAESACYYLHVRQRGTPP